MAVEMYSTNPSLFGGGAILAASWFASRPGFPASAVWPYVLVAFGYLFFVMALSTTASVGLDGLLKVCAVMGALPSGLSAWWLWRTPFFPLAIVCVVGGSVVLSWGWIASSIIRNRDRRARPEKKDP
jgi:hypothetical protein